MGLIDHVLQSGQVIWLDDLSRPLLDDGRLARYRDHLGVGGVTVNPTILDAAISDGPGYEVAVEEARHRGVDDAEAVLWDLVVEDVQRAADLFLSRYRGGESSDGLVSIELAPSLADDAEATVEAGLALAARIDRPNVMVKVPGTPAGAVAIEELTAAGVNVNVTLLFGISQYQKAHRAYLAGLGRRVAAGLDVSGIHSVASFFLSRIDAAANGSVPVGERNKLALAAARLAHDRWLSDLTIDPMWIAAEAAGARRQRLLWASTSPKDPDLPGSFYPERLIAPATIVTVAPRTLEAMAGADAVPALRLDRRDVGHADYVVDTAREHGIDLEDLAADLQRQGVEAFASSWDSLLTTIGAAVGSAR